MMFRPLQDQVPIRRIEQKAKTAGGIFIPETVKEMPTEGEVATVGLGARTVDGRVQPLDVELGDRVLFGIWSGIEIKIDGEDIVIMQEAGIMGIVERDAASKRKGA